MVSEDKPSASANDIQEDDDDDSMDSMDEPGDEVPDFIDEIEASNSTVLVTAASLYGNPDYNPKCPGLDRHNCKENGPDDTHLRQ